ncbi:TPR-like protein [Fusarium austroafricanum]|uniref:TPR-like protein n=1 Tax=Fusarium austroafricanum TaxID=2364996 RepID=A0A8H4K9J1_9HYPO|nr:TPR-like protein [Fusarium austroafricanum]
MDPWDATQYMFHPFIAVHQQGLHLQPDSSTLPEQGLNEHFIADQNHAPGQLIPPQASAFQGPQNASPASNADDAQMMPPPPKQRRKKAPTLRAKDWEPYKARILELHDTQKKPLQKVKEIMEEEFNFVAEIRQYRTRITQWGKDKNIKPAEMAAIVRKRQQRKILESDKNEQNFTVRGREVETYKIDRWMTRNEVSHTALYAPSPAASHSPASSTMSLNFSSAGNTPIPSYPVPPSPALSVQEIYQSRGSSFTGQSPALSYRTLQAHLPVSHPPAPGLFQGQQQAELVPKRSRYRQAEEEILRKDISVAEILFGASHPRTLHLLEKLAEVLMDQGRYKSAEEMVRRAVEGHRNTTGNRSINTLEALQILGNILCCQGLYRQAQKLQHWILESKKSVLGEEHPSTLRSMSELVTTYIHHNLWKEAEELGVRVLEMRRRILGEEDPETLTSQHNMAVIYRNCGRLKEAEELCMQVLEMEKRILGEEALGEEALGTISSMYNLASVYHDQRRWDDAEVLLTQVVDMRTRIFGEEHPNTLRARAELISTYESQQRYKEAEVGGEQVLEMQKRILGEKHPETRVTAHDVLRVYEKQGKYEKAEYLRSYIQETRSD